KVRAGRVEEIEDRPAQTARTATNVVDLTELLKRSLKGGGGARAARTDDDEDARAPSHATAARRKPAAKTSAKRTAKTPANAPAKRAAAKHGATGTHAAKKAAVRRKHAA
ncbi:Ku protein, partial [Burkholderia contaminans]